VVAVRRGGEEEEEEEGEGEGEGVVWVEGFGRGPSLVLHAHRGR
jgi:hypothetical protein